MISVVIPVHNEESRIDNAIKFLRETSPLYPTEIVVVDGGSADRTREIASGLADKVLSSSKVSRGLQMRLGAQKSGGDPIVFLHADTQLPSNWQEIVRKAFIENPNPPVAAAFSLDFDSDGFPYKWITGLSKLRTKFTGIPQGDQGLIVRRDAYFSSGGFDDVPLMEEYLFIPKLKRLGEVRIFRERIVTSVRKYEKKGPLRNSLANSFFILLFYLGVSPKKLAEWYRWRF